MTRATWIFGYGSLASPASIASTIGREPRPAMRVAHVEGFGRRWNYGSKVLRGDWTHDGIDVVGGLVVSLGVQAGPDESCNGVVFRVDADELARLDWRERDYARVDVTEAVTIDERDGDDGVVDGAIEIYVPRPSAIDRYERARDERRAAVRSEYWQLVRESFAALGDSHAEWYDRTLAPDVPIVDVALHPLG
ncbi:MAG: gamma-glutamylcyclotransferase [Ilumatobacter sp.]|nr:gamma-glutamylcyclotransferase [Ilumatobacter sp.]